MHNDAFIPVTYLDLEILTLIHSTYRFLEHFLNRWVRLKWLLLCLCVLSRYATSSTRLHYVVGNIIQIMKVG